MKNIKSIIIALTIFFSIWLIVASIGYTLSDNITFKECMRHNATIMFMVTFGWMPSVINLVYDTTS